jgi:hypothetical protein
MNKIFLMSSVAALSLATLVGVACDDDDTNTTNGTTTGSMGGNGGTGNQGGSGATGGGGGTSIPEIPTLGAQVDRMGRPAINTAADNTFTDDTTRHDAEVEYNSNDDPTTWATDYVDDFKATLAILDSLDETCGNQVAFDAAGNPDYTTLATVLANDWLIVDSTSTDCDTYLGVEASALGAIPAGKCGGRKTNFDVIETTYSAVAGIGLSGFDDTIDAGSASTVATFPYLGPPN